MSDSTVGTGRQLKFSKVRISLEVMLPACDLYFACRLVQVCLAYSQRHPSTAADELATAALNLLALAVLAGTDGREAPAVALIQSMVQAGAGREAWQGSSLLDQLKASRQPPPCCLVLLLLVHQAIKMK